MQHPHFATEACVFLEQFDQSAYDWHRAETFDESSGEWFGTVLRGAIGVDSTIRRDQNLPNIACTLEPVDSDAGDFPPVSNVDATSIRQFLPEEVGLYRLFIRGEQTPIRESRVALGDETDMFGIPRLEVDWRIADRDLRAYGHYLKKVGAEFARLGLGRIWTRLDADDRLDFESVWGGGHHMGTTKMSENPVDGVVNPDCRIHAIENLYVAGSSVFPTIVALAHRLADHLKEVSG
jgi:choline dehydrogenase-like flavoprotein